MLANGLDDLTMLAIFAVVIDRDDGVRRRHQQQYVEDQAEEQAWHDQHEVEYRREKLAVEQQRQRRNEDGENVDHRSQPQRIAERIAKPRSAQKQIATL